MVDLDTIPHHAAIEEITDVVSNKTQNPDKALFRISVAYFLCKMAACMRTTVLAKDRGNIPVNMYACSLAVSGAGKGFSINILENEFIKGFRDRFMADTFPVISEQHVRDIAMERSTRSGKQYDEELHKAEKEFHQAGEYPFTFDSGTPAAVKQLRQKLLMSKVGSINLQIDEIGSNLIGSTDILNVYLELYDQGTIKAKLTKNTAENVRSEDMDGRTPANMLMFGTPSKLLDGGKIEEEFMSFLDTGFARRCFFALGEKSQLREEISPAEMYHRLTQSSNQMNINKWANHFILLGDPAKYGQQILLPDDVAIELLTYKMECQRLAELLPEHEEIKNHELKHRYDKALKLAGALAFIDESPEVTMMHLHQAMKLTEESGQSFHKIMNREANYVKLARYIATVGTEVNHTDLLEALPYYKSGKAARDEMITLATAWGRKNQIIIKKMFVDGIEVFKGETLQKTDLDALRISHSGHVAYNYNNDYAPFNRLHELTQMNNYHWLNHHLIKGDVGNGHRDGNNVITGFDMIVIDVDGGVKLEAVHELLKDYKFLTYTTKRHTEEEHRFRLILPMDYHLELDEEDYKEFMQNVFAWLPFDVDEETCQRCRKWETKEGNWHLNEEGELISSMQFIPKTSGNETFKASIQKLGNMDNIERWFAQRMVTGSRNNQLLKFGMMLKDCGLNFVEVEERVKAFNNKLENKLSSDEIDSTILKSIAQKFSA